MPLVSFEFIPPTAVGPGESGYRVEFLRQGPTTVYTLGSATRRDLRHFGQVPMFSKFLGGRRIRAGLGVFLKRDSENVGNFHRHKTS